jgi:hypothetical protein
MTENINKNVSEPLSKTIGKQLRENILPSAKISILYFLPTDMSEAFVATELFLINLSVV